MGGGHDDEGAKKRPRKRQRDTWCPGAAGAASSPLAPARASSLAAAASGGKDGRRLSASTHGDAEHGESSVLNASHSFESGTTAPAEVAALMEKLAAREAEIEYLQEQLAAADDRKASGEEKSADQALLRGLAADAAGAVVEKLRGELEGKNESLALLQGQYEDAQRHIATLTFQLEQVGG